MKRIIDRHQTCEMGNGLGHFELPKNITLDKVLDCIKQNAKSWGTITIFRNSEIIIRCFDYDLYNNNIFYHYLSSIFYQSVVKEVKFKYCYMHEDIEIYIK